VTEVSTNGEFVTAVKVKAGLIKKKKKEGRGEGIETHFRIVSPPAFLSKMAHQRNFRALQKLAGGSRVIYGGMATGNLSVSSQVY